MLEYKGQTRDGGNNINIKLQKNQKEHYEKNISKRVHDIITGVAELRISSYRLVWLASYRET